MKQFYIVKEAIKATSFDYYDLEVKDVELDDIKKDSNGKYYLTFDFKAEAYGEENDYKAYFTLHVEDDRLVREDIINYTGKKARSIPDMPVIQE